MNRSSERVVQWGVIAALCIAVFFLAWNNQQTSDNPYSQSQQNPSRAVPAGHEQCDWFWHETFNNPEALWGFIGCIFGGVAFVFVWFQLRETQHATQQTERSVTASINRDRGRLALSEIDVSRNGILMPEFRYTNIGETAVLLLDSSFMFQVFQTRDDVNRMPVELPDNRANREEPVAFTKNASLWRRSRIRLILPDNAPEGVLANPAPVQNVTVAELNASQKWLVLRGWILYNTVFGHTHRQWVAMIYQPQRRAWTIAEMGRWNRDREVVQPIT